MAVLALIALATGGCDSKSPQGSSARGKQGAAVPPACGARNCLPTQSTTSTAWRSSTPARWQSRSAAAPRPRPDRAIACRNSAATHSWPTWPEPETSAADRRLAQPMGPDAGGPGRTGNPTVCSTTSPRGSGRCPQSQGLDKMEFSTLRRLCAARGRLAPRRLRLGPRQEARRDRTGGAAVRLDRCATSSSSRTDPDRVPQFPWEILLFGRGTAMERAWVFILLCRQQGIDAALLALPETASSLSPAVERAQEKAAATTSPARLRLWCVGVLVEGKTCLFDPNLGLPIPAPTASAPGRAASWRSCRRRWSRSGRTAICCGGWTAT